MPKTAQEAHRTGNRLSLHPLGEKIHNGAEYVSLISRRYILGQLRGRISGCGKGISDH